MIKYILRRKMFHLALGRLLTTVFSGVMALALLHFIDLRTVSGQVHHHDPTSLGKVALPISCSEKARAEFTLGLSLLHHMTYPQAQSAFERAAGLDPACAMAQWGIAVSFFQPLWPTRPTPEALQLGWAAVKKAKASEPPTELERMFVAAAEAFFLDPESNDYWLRIRRWEQASAKLYTAFPQNSEAAVFYALALLATAPSNVISRTNADRAAEILLQVYKKNPDHPGAMHYLVHANDVPGREKELLEITRKYDSIAPRNPHALHMPTHIYTRLGDWDAVIKGNIRAADAALEYPAGPSGEYVWDEFPHAMEYLVYALLQKGADDQAAAQWKRLRDTARLEPSFKTAFHISSIQARLALERRDWQSAVLIVPRRPADLNWDRFTWPEAIVRFARGLGMVHLGNTSEAEAEIKSLTDLETATGKMKEELFARNVRVLRLELSSWVTHAKGEEEASLTLMQEAVEMEASTPKHAVTPGPTLPAQEQLGELFMQQKRPREALTAFKRSLENYPNRFNSMLGAARAADVLGSRKESFAFYQQLLGFADAASRRPEVKVARKYRAW